MRNIVIIGAGALGSHVMLFSRGFAARFTVIDFDRVEQKNTLSQFHSRMGVGRNKANAMQQAMQGLFGVRIGAVPHKLTADNVDALLGKADILVDCVDNAEARELIQSFAIEHDIPCLHGALAADGQYARAVWTEHFSIDDGGAGKATCEDGRHLPFIATTSAALATALQAFLGSGVKRSVHLHPTGQVVVA